MKKNIKKDTILCLQSLQNIIEEQKENKTYQLIVDGKQLRLYFNNTHQLYAYELVGQLTDLWERARWIYKETEPTLIINQETNQKVQAILPENEYEQISQEILTTIIDNMRIEEEHTSLKTVPNKTPSKRAIILNTPLTINQIINLYLEEKQQQEQILPDFGTDYDEIRNCICTLTQNGKTLIESGNFPDIKYDAEYLIMSGLHAKPEGITVEKIIENSGMMTPSHILKATKTLHDTNCLTINADNGVELIPRQPQPQNTTSKKTPTIDSDSEDNGEYVPLRFNQDTNKPQQKTDTESMSGQVLTELNNAISKAKEKIDELQKLEQSLEQEKTRIEDEISKLRAEQESIEDRRQKIRKERLNLVTKMRDFNAL